MRSFTLPFLLLGISLLVLGLGPLGTFAYADEGDPCPNATDLVIALDASVNVTEEDYAQATHFIANLASYFPGRHHRVAFLTFADEPHMKFWLDNNFSSQDMYAWFNKPKPTDGENKNRYAGGAIDAAVQELEARARYGVPQKIVVFTNGLSTLPRGDARGVIRYAAVASVAARDRNIVTFAIEFGAPGKGDDFRDEFNLLAADKSENRFHIEEEFEKILNKIRSTSFNGRRYLKCIVPVDDIPKTCYKDNDIVILLDSSGSVGPEDYKKAKVFVSRLARAFVAPNRIALITYSTDVVPRFGLNDKLSPNEIQDKISNHPYDAGWTFTGGGIKAAMEECERHKRPGVAMKIVVLTDGESSWPLQDGVDNSATGYFPTGKSRTIQESAKVKSSDIVMFSVGIGWKATQPAMREELLTIAGGVAENKFTVADFEALLKRIREISIKVCGTIEYVLDEFGSYNNSLVRL